MISGVGKLVHMARYETRKDGDFHSHVRRVRADHYLHRFVFGCLLLYIFQLHGLWASLAGLVLIPAMIAAINTVILARSGSLARVRAARWGVLFLMFIVLGLGSATIESVR